MSRLLLATLLLLFGIGHAQGQDGPPPAPAAGAASAAVTVTPLPTPAVVPGAIQSANIFEIAPDAASDPGYARQHNAARAKVQPGNNAPMWRAVGGGVTGTSSLPPSQAPEAGNLIQPMVKYPGSRFTTAGEGWRQVRNQWLLPYGGALLLIVVLAIALYYWRRGGIGLRAQETGRTVERFTPFERAAHWTNAIAFSVLAVSGLVMAFGKFVLLPLLGLTLHGWLSYALKNLHNFAGPLFAVSLLIIIVTFLRDNLPRRADVMWVLKGGLWAPHGLASHRFNAGEKLVFWLGVCLFGLVAVGSGLVMDHLVPGLVYTRATMQIAHLVHAAAAVLMMAVMLGHIYMGTLGVAGAYRAMRTGQVDEAWAQEHHQLWWDDIEAGRIPRQRSAVPPAAAPSVPAGGTP